jgi:2,4-dienoyl-CoA reductase-like NADH-dependent reductase (Old Yellow Enzyme family)
LTAAGIVRVASLKGISRFQEHLESLRLRIPCDEQLMSGPESPLAQPLFRGGIRIGNRIAIHPMEGWDGAFDGNPTEQTLRRWRRFGASGAKLIWGGEAVAVSHDGRANPHQLLAASHTRAGLNRLRTTLIDEHRRTAGSEDQLMLGLQLTHSGRYSHPNLDDRAEPLIAYHHPILDRRQQLPPQYPLLTDEEIGAIVENFHRAGALAWELGFDFVDIKHCHGYLAHELLSAHTRQGRYGGSFENRTRFLREVVEGIRSAAPGLKIGVRLSAFDSVPFRADPELSSPGKLGPGIPEVDSSLVPYRWGFGLDPQNPLEPDLRETVLLLSLLEQLDIKLVNLTAGSPYYCPHIQRPALFPPSDGYLPPEDPLVGVARQMNVARRLKQQFPNLIIVGSGYSYLQDFLPAVAQAAVRAGWVDIVGLGRMALTYPSLLHDVLEGSEIDRKRICRTFSDCTTAPRSGLPSGCYPLDRYYRESDLGARLRTVKARIGAADAGEEAG